MRISTAKARKDYPNEMIVKGQVYYYCEPQRRKTGGVRKIRSTSKQFIENWIRNYMSRFRGEFASNMDEWRTRLGELSTQEEKDELYEEVQAFYEEKCDNLSNVPDQLQESHVLNEQIEELDSFMEEIESTEVEQH